MYIVFLLRMALKLKHLAASFVGMPLHVIKPGIMPINVSEIIRDLELNFQGQSSQNNCFENCSITFRFR